MEKTIKMPLTGLTPVIKLLVELGVYAEELAVSDTYIYRDLKQFPEAGFRDEYPKRFKLDGDKTYISTRSNPRVIRARYDYMGRTINNNPTFAEIQRHPHWTIWINPGEVVNERTRMREERYNVLDSSFYKIFRVNKVFLNEIITEIGKGNRKNYTKTKGLSRIVKKKEVVYNEWRIATLKRLQFVIKEDEVISLLEEQARKLQESGLATI